MTIATGGSVGIGVTNPQDFNTAANRLVVGDGVGHQGLSIFAGTSSSAGLFFADGAAGTAAYQGFIDYRHNNSDMRFGAAGGTRMVMNGNGLLIFPNGGPPYSPSAELEIASSAATIRLTDSDLTNHYSEIEKAGTYTYLSSRANASDGGFIFFGSATDTEFLRIDTAGNVGIGTTNPTAQLHVHGSAGSLRIHSSAGGANVYLESQAGNLSRVRWNGLSNFAIRDDNDNADRLVVTTDGNIVANDNKKFQGTTYSSSYIKFSDDTTVSANSDIIFDVNGSTELMRLEEGGYVGIGTSSPSYELDVNGTTRSTFYIGGAYLEENASSSKLKFYTDGTVLVMDKDGELKPCEKENDTLVFGVSKKDFDSPVVLGAEPILVTGPIKVGDYIVTSSKQGHGQAMKEQNIGTIIAQAMESGDGESYNIKAMIRKM